MDPKTVEGFCLYEEAYKKQNQSPFCITEEKYLKVKGCGNARLDKLYKNTRLHKGWTERKLFIHY